MSHAVTKSFIGAFSYREHLAKNLLIYAGKGQNSATLKAFISKPDFIFGYKQAQESLAAAMSLYSIVTSWAEDGI